MDILSIFNDKKRCKLMINALENELACIRKMLNERPLIPMTFYVREIHDLLDDLKIREKVLDRMDK